MADIDLKIEGLKKHFGGVRAVDGISVRIQGNELIGLIGPNGSGKTTTINTINGLLNPTAGKIIFQGEPLKNLNGSPIMNTIQTIIEKVGGEDAN